MRKRIIRRKSMVVDGQPYQASLTAIYREEAVALRLTVRADFGARSFAAIRGLHNFDYFDHYGQDTADGIELTPRMIATLIRYARKNGWSPESEASNRDFELTNEDARLLLAADKTFEI